MEYIFSKKKVLCLPSILSVASIRLLLRACYTPARTKFFFSKKWKSNKQSLHVVMAQQSDPIQVQPKKVSLLEQYQA